MKFARWVVPAIGVVDAAVVLLFAWGMFEFYRSSMDESCGSLQWESPFLVAFGGVWLAVAVAVAWRSGWKAWEGSHWVTLLVFVAASAAISPAIYIIGTMVSYDCLRSG